MLGGLKFFFIHVLQKQWPVFEYLKAQKEKLTAFKVHSEAERHKTCINKSRVTIHTLRHSCATHLLEEGVNIRVIRRYLGHTMLETTMVYLHLTQKGQEDAYAIINQTMKGSMATVQDIFRE